MDKVLQGTRVLDFCRYIAGAYCCMTLSDMGAEVIRVEPPGGADDRNLGPFSPDGQALVYGITLQRNKKGITLNLRRPGAAEVLKDLVRNADIVVHNFALGSQEATLLDYSLLRETNPAVIEVVITGFGQYGPNSERACFDSIAQAMSGAMSYTGFPGTPPVRSGVQYVDFSTGLNAALGAVLALLHRKQSGAGQLVDISLFDVAFSMVAAAGGPAEYAVLGEVRKQVGNNTFYSYANSFAASDGWIVVNVIGDSAWRRFCGVLGREDLLADARFQDNMGRFVNREEIHALVAEWIKTKSVAEAMKLLEGAGLPCGPVQNVAQAVTDPQVAAREMLPEVDQPGAGPIPVPGVAIKLSATPGEIRGRAPRVGEHNEEVYGKLVGYGQAKIARLREEGLI